MVVLRVQPVTDELLTDWSMSGDGPATLVISHHMYADSVTSSLYAQIVAGFPLATIVWPKVDRGSVMTRPDCRVAGSWTVFG
jgi:hypothetical protein